MDPAPDFGKLLASQGWQKDGEFTFLPFPLDNIARLDTGGYSTMANIECGGKPYAVSIDFDDAIYETILGCLPASPAADIKNYFKKTKGPAALRFKNPFQIIICAKLGEEVQNEMESYIPWIAVEVRPYAI